MRKSTRRDTSRMVVESIDNGIAPLTGELLEAVAATWKRDQRSFSVRFGGVSMLPSIGPGEEVQLICSTTVPPPGAIIAYIYEGQIAVHRLLAKSADGNWLATCGDVHLLPDPPVPSTAVIGLVALMTRTPPPFRRRRIVSSFASALITISPRLYRRCIHLLAALRNVIYRVETPR